MSNFAPTGTPAPTPDQSSAAQSPFATPMPAPGQPPTSPPSAAWAASTGTEGPAGPTPTPGADASTNADPISSAGFSSSTPPPPPNSGPEPEVLRPPSGGKRLYRRTENKLFLGVCSGLADYFDIDVTLVRAGFAAGSLLVGTGFVLYLVLALVMPAESALDLDPRIAAQQTMDEAVDEVRRGVDAVTNKARDLTGRKKTDA